MKNALLALWCHLPFGRRRACTTLSGRRFRSPGFPTQSRNDIFWHSLLGPVIGGQVHRILPIGTEKWEEKKALLDEKTVRILRNAEFSSRAMSTRESVVKQFSTSFVKDKFDLDNAIPTKRSLPVWGLTELEVGKKKNVNKRIGWVQDSPQTHQRRRIQRTKPRQSSEFQDQFWKQFAGCATMPTCGCETPKEKFSWHQRFSLG